MVSTTTFLSVLVSTEILLFAPVLGSALNSIALKDLRMIILAHLFQYFFKVLLRYAKLLAQQLLLISFLRFILKLLDAGVKDGLEFAGGGTGAFSNMTDAELRLLAWQQWARFRRWIIGITHRSRKYRILRAIIIKTL